MLFKDNYYFLSNMYPCSITYSINNKEYVFKCSEAIYQAMKCPEQAELFVPMNGYEAKKAGKSGPIREDWDEVKLDIMKDIIRAKFDQNTGIRKQLCMTEGDIVEENTWYDIYWGVCKGTGENHLGKILMDIRNSYQTFYCLVVGSRDFEDYDTLCKVLDKVLQNYKHIVIVSGGCEKGADNYAEQYAKDRGYSLTVMPAEWYPNGKYDKSAGYKRNKAMHEYIATFPHRGVVAFWDGKSKGTSHTFDLAPKYNNQLKIYNYTEKKFIPNPKTTPSIKEEEKSSSVSPTVTSAMGR